MACVNPDGSLTPVAEKVLRALAASTVAETAQAVALATGLPIYRVRASLRELEDAGLLTGEPGPRRVSAAGLAKLASLAPSPAAGAGLHPS
ncbi:MAG TPA: hypothetical protein VFN38_05920 [Gemmatimonadaceae bacterium]|nr:hypothetical protein [Gemmatimonadaceae bacterium]